jgi:hypothetical protein
MPFDSCSPSRFVPHRGEKNATKEVTANFPAMERSELYLRAKRHAELQQDSPVQSKKLRKTKNVLKMRGCLQGPNFPTSTGSLFFFGEVEKAKRRARRRVTQKYEQKH